MEDTGGNSGGEREEVRVRCRSLGFEFIRPLRKESSRELLKRMLDYDRQSQHDSCLENEHRAGHRDRVLKNWLMLHAV
jgi:hypothetical protein